MQSLNVIGLGYIGLPTAALFADAGLVVHGTEISDYIIDCVNEGHAHFGEPDLDVLINKVVKSGFLKASQKIVASDAYIITVPTPLTEDKKPDLSYVNQAIDALIPVLKEEDLIIVESTIPPGTCEGIAHKIAEKRKDLRPAKAYNDNVNLYIAHCPERVLPGRIIFELVHNDRVIGGLSRQCTQRALELYKYAVKGDCHPSNAVTAELVKLSENAYRDVNIAFANELSMICANMDINVWSVLELANRHPRVNILRPGPGVGGHCIAVDPWFIIDAVKGQAPIMKTAREINDGKPDFVIQSVRKAAEKIRDPNILCLGLTYKADVDDIRESPSLYIAEQLAEEFGKNLFVSDPLLSKKQRNELSEQFQMLDFESGLKDADIIILLTDHTVFKTIHHNDLMQKIVIDTRGLWH